MPNAGNPADDLVLRVRAGDEAAFEETFRAHHAGLCTFVSRYVQSREVAAEIVQDLFFYIWTEREQWEINSSVRGYLYGAARNRALNHVKRSGIEKRWLESASIEQNALFYRAIAERSLEQHHDDENIEQLRRAFVMLPERCALIMTMRWHHQLRYSEIAEALGISIKAVEHQLHRGIRTLREHVLGGDSNP